MTYKAALSLRVCRRIPSRRSPRNAAPAVVLLALAALVAGRPTAVTASHDCSLPGRNFPAVPVPECVDFAGHAAACDSAGAFRLWPIGFRPASSIPPRRDSTDRVAGKGTPGATLGWELFSSVDVLEAGGAPRRLYVSYNAGIQVWSLEEDPADPIRRTHADGWQGAFLSFPPKTEVLNFLEEISAVNLDADNDLVGASAVKPVGPTLWRYNVPSNGLQALYQDPDTEGRQVRLIQRTNGNVVAYVGTNDGVAVYDASAANDLAGPCVDDHASGSSPCASVYRGIFGGGPSSFIDVLYDSESDRVLVSVAGGLFANLELWELTDPRSPGSAIVRFSDLTHSLGNAIFEHDGHTYLAVVDEQEGLNEERLQILLVDACVSGSDCSLADGTVEAAIHPIPIAGYPTAHDFLTFSRVGDVPYLYYGLATGNLEGPDLERLWDLSALSPSSFPLPGLPEVTASGASYVDPCNGETIRYWSHYYSSNAHGLNNMVPRIGMFSSDGYFYRAAATILDVHRLEVASTAEPTVVTRVVDPAPHYFEELITFQAAATSCGGGDWTWFAGDTDALGLGSGNALQSISWNLCSGPAPCSEKSFQVWALNDNCSNHPDLVEERATILVEDPRPSVAAVDLSPPGGTYPVCTQLELLARAEGRAPLSYSWAVSRDGDLIDSGVGNPFVWDTTGLSLPASQIFADGFESGDTSAWGAAADPEPQGTFDIEVVANNDTGSPASFSLAVTVTSVPDPAFDSPPITATGVGGSRFEISAGTTGATEWRWEIEDPGNGSSGPCEVYPSCFRVDWSPSPEISYRWEPPNDPGTYRVTSWARNCVTLDVGEAHAEIEIAVDQVGATEPPIMTDFRVHHDSTPPCVNDFFFFTCPLGAVLEFQLEAEGDFTTFEVDWEADGNWHPYPAGSRVTHTYTTAGPRSPLPRARASGHGQVSAPRVLFGSGFVIE